MISGTPIDEWLVAKYAVPRRYRIIPNIYS